MTLPFSNNVCGRSLYYLPVIRNSSRLSTSEKTWGKARGVPDDLPVLLIDQINRDQSSNPVMNV